MYKIVCVGKIKDDFIVKGINEYTKRIKGFVKFEIIEVKDFGELIKLSEELYKPILYWNSNQKEEAEFFVITNNVIYKFILKVK